MLMSLLLKLKFLLLKLKKWLSYLKPMLLILMSIKLILLLLIKPNKNSKKVQILSFHLKKIFILSNKKNLLESSRNRKISKTNLELFTMNSKRLCHLISQWMYLLSRFQMLMGRLMNTEVKSKSLKKKVWT